jgi:transporter family protein
MNWMQHWVFWALLSAVFAALTAIFAKVGLEGVDSDFATWLRTLIIAAVLGLLIWQTGKWTNPMGLPRGSLVFLTLSALATGASWLCYFRALQMGRASQVAPVDKLSVVLVALFAVAFLGERPSLREWFAVGLVLVGVLLLAWKPQA